MRLSRPVAWLLALVVVLFVLALVPAPTHNRLQSVLLDAAHFPAFGFVALVSLRLTLMSARFSHRPRWFRYLLALGFTVAVGGLTELSQGLNTRDADWMDWLRNAAGGAVAMLVVLALDHSFIGTGRWRWPRRAALVAAGIVFSALALRPTAIVLTCYHQRNAAFPRVCDFYSPWQRAFMVTRHTGLQLVPRPAAWAGFADELVARATFWPGGTPALILREAYPDWTGYDRLAFDVYSEEPVRTEIELRIDDLHHNNQYTDRFNRTLGIVPGENHIEIPLSEVSQAPRGRVMDLKHVRSVTIFVAQPVTSTTLLLAPLRLERR